MKFEENLFRVLNVSIYDTKTKIDAQADDLSFADPDREEIIGRARDILLNPRKRIAAEVRQLVDENLDIENLSEDILRVDKKFSALNAEEIRKKINDARKKSKFPAVNDTDAIKDELKNLRGEIREEIQDALKAMNHNERIKFATELADYYEFADEGVVIEDFFESYRLEMAAFIDDTTEKIIALSGKFEFRFKAEFSQYLYELEPKLAAFVHVQQLLDKFSEILGRDRFDDSEKVFYEVRNVAIKLFNEKNLIDYPLQIIRLLEENFSYLPKLAELIRKDVKFLEDAKKNRPTQNFLKAKAELDKIQSEIDKWLHFEKGFEQVNQDFYTKIFKPHFESVLKNILKCFELDSEEVRKLNRMIAEIYIQVGNAMTWAERADLAYKCFEKALPYAEAAYNANLVSLVRQRINEWRAASEEISAQVPVEYRSNFLTRNLWKCLIGIKEILYGLAMIIGELALMYAVFLLIYWLLSH